MARLTSSAMLINDYCNEAQKLTQHTGLGGGGGLGVHQHSFDFSLGPIPFAADG